MSPAPASAGAGSFFGGEGGCAGGLESDVRSMSPFCVIGEAADVAGSSGVWRPVVTGRREEWGGESRGNIASEALMMGDSKKFVSSNRIFSKNAFIYNNYDIYYFSCLPEK